MHSDPTLDSKLNRLSETTPFSDSFKTKEHFENVGLYSDADIRPRYIKISHQAPTSKEAQGRRFGGGQDQRDSCSCFGAQDHGP